MARRSNPPTVRLRRLATEMRRLRLAAGLTREQVTEMTAINNVTLYRVETSRARPQKRTLMALLDLYQVPDAQRCELLEICQGAEYPDWLRPYRSELPEVYAAFLSFEDEARSARCYESLQIPALLQTEEYAHAAIKGILAAASPRQVEQRVRVEMRRQELLRKPDPIRYATIVDEAALHRLVGGAWTMRTQLQHLLTLIEQPHLTFQVLPWHKGAHPGMPGQFIHLEFPDSVDPDLVYVQSMAGDLLLESEADVRRCRLTFDQLRTLALSPEDSMKLIAAVAYDA